MTKTITASLRPVSFVKPLGRRRAITPKGGLAEFSDADRNSSWQRPRLACPVRRLATDFKAD